MKTHKELEAWKLSVELVTEIYQLTSAYPKDEVFGLSIILEDHQFQFLVI